MRNCWFKSLWESKIVLRLFSALDFTFANDRNAVFLQKLRGHSVAGDERPAEGAVIYVTAAAGRAVFLQDGGIRAEEPGQIKRGLRSAGKLGRDIGAGF